MTDETNALPMGFNLHRYQIDKVLGAGGFGITYRAIHEALENRVAIKEYFPAEWAYRDHNGTTVRPNAQGQIPARSGEPACYDWGLQRFLDEAKILVQINHPCVVRVRDYFTAHGSAYIVMEYEDGESLSMLLQRGGILPETELRHLLDDILPALEAVHGQGYLHRDIKPSNLYIRSFDTRVVLIDFGAARQALGRRTRSVTSVVTPGYSPIEQYVTVGEDYGPWTDIYALGAVLYRCITGAPPIEAPGRVLKDPVQPAMECGAGLYSRALLQVTDRALAVRPEDRFQTVAEMREALRVVEQKKDRSGFAEVPQLQPELLNLGSTNGKRAPAQPPLASSPLALSDEDPWSGASRLERRSKPRSTPTGTAPSLAGPFHQSIEVSAPQKTTPSWDRIGTDPVPRSPTFKDERGGSTQESLPLPDDGIWAKMTKADPASAIPSANTPREGLSSFSPETSSQPSLLKRSPHSAVEHLRKASTRARVTVTTGLTTATTTAASTNSTLEFQEPSLVEAQGATTVSPDELGSDAISYGPRTQINWRWILLMVFAISSLSGTGLLGYEYYRSYQERQSKEAAATQQLQQQEQEEEIARLAREETRQRDIQFARYLEQSRTAIATRDWAAAQTNLDRAASLNSEHPDLAALRNQLSAAQRSGASSSTQTEPKTGIQLAKVEKGCFTMGSPTNERDRSNDEISHQACVKGFWISTTEITNAQFRRFKPDHNSGSFQGRPLNQETQPAVNLTWSDAKAFTEWLSWEGGTGKRFRLPTEAEWEYATRAGTTTRYFWGNDIDARYANFSDRNDPSGASISSLNDRQAVTAPVSSYLPNTWGLYDLAGNVWEWTCSEYDANYSGQEQGCSDKRGNEGLRALRGGSWNNGPGELRSAKRQPRKPDYRDAMTGFRVLMEE